MKRRVARGFAIAGVLLAVVLFRVVYGSIAELEAGDGAHEAGDDDGALIHWRRAAKWYAPGNPYSVRALDHLAALGAARERSGDVEGALAAWRSVRGAIFATRTLTVPHSERRARADDHIARLMARQPPPPIDAGKTESELYDEHLALLSETPGPRPGFALLALLGFFGWVGGAFLLASRGIDAEDRVHRPEALKWLAVVVVGFAVFAVGLLYA